MERPGGFDPTVLPPITTIGANTFGCKVNGEVWVAEVPVNWHGLVPLWAEYREQGLKIGATRKPESAQGWIYQSINLYSFGPINSDTLFLDDPYEPPYNGMTKPTGRYADIRQNCELWTDSINTGFIHFIRFDSINEIISGTFEFTAVEEGCDTVRITEGRFDIAY